MRGMWAIEAAHAVRCTANNKKRNNNINNNTHFQTHAQTQKTGHQPPKTYKNATQTSHTRINQASIA